MGDLYKRGGFFQAGGKMNEQTYEAPSIVELGSVAEVTLGDGMSVPDGLVLAPGS